MIARLRGMDRKVAIALIIAATAALAGPFRLAVGFHSPPVGHHSHPTDAPYITLFKYAGSWQVETGQILSYTIYANNYSPITGTLAEIVDTLPEGFEYVPGSTTGRILADPVVDGRKLRWKKRMDLAHGHHQLLRFEARASSRPGRYYNVVDGKIKGPGVVNGSGATAAVIVGAPTELEAAAVLLKDGSLRLKFSARLTSRGRPLAGQWIDFRTQGSPYTYVGCSAATNSQGVAECTGAIPLATSIAALGYEAEFNPYWWEDSFYAPASDHGDLIE